MPKPTIFQVVLGKPSQTYYFPQERDYHSTKQDLVRIANEAAAAGESPRASSSRSFLSLPTTTSYLSAEMGRAQHKSPRTSVRVKSSTSHDSSDDDNDVFYTPRSSLVSSPRTSTAHPPSIAVETPPLPTALLPSKSTPKPAPIHPPPLSPNSSTSSVTTTTSTTSSSASLYSSRATTSTKISTPVHSDPDHRHKPSSSKTTTTVISSSRSQHKPSSSTSKAAAHRRSLNASRLLTYTDEDWAQDVRWLAPDGTHTYSPRRADIPSPLPAPDPPVPPARKRRSGRGRMSAVQEEDESGSGSSLESEDSTSEREEDARSSQPATTESMAMESPDARMKAYARGHHRSVSMSVSSYVASLPTHSIPAPLPASSSPPQNGYTGLTLPTAAYVGGKIVNDGKVDLVKAGLAQSSMATVEIVRGVAQTNGRKRRLSFSLPWIGKGKESRTPAHLRGTLPLPVTFTSHIPPPSRVSSSHVLVQVFAVALDTMDSLIVQDKVKSGSKNAGYIPGRGFVGRAIECGWEVREDVCKRGEWVIGLLDVRKCGALSEFIVVERHRIHRAPQPRSPALFSPNPSRRSHTRSSSLPTNVPSSNAPPLLTFEELAVLPLCGLPAYRALHTFADAFAKVRGEETRRPHALVLQGHDGPGAFAVQMLSRRGIYVCVQVPRSAIPDDDASPNPDPATLSKKANGKQPVGSKPRGREAIEAQIRAWGADEICVEEPLALMERLTGEGRGFDAVLDTVGGAAVWEAAQKLLLVDPYENASPIVVGSPRPPASSASSGGRTRNDSINGYTSEGGGGKARARSVQCAQFTTLVGDALDRAVPTAHDNMKAGMRSLRRASSLGRKGSIGKQEAAGRGADGASIRKDSASVRGSDSASIRAKDASKARRKRVVAYAWVSVAADVDLEGGDVRDSLGAVVGMVEEGRVRPHVKEGSVVPFERAPEVFRRDEQGPVGLLKDGGICVAKIAG